MGWQLAEGDAAGTKRVVTLMTIKAKKVAQRSTGYLLCFYPCVLLYYIHLLDETLATTELVYYKEYIADIDVDATLQVIVEVDVAAE